LTQIEHEVSQIKHSEISHKNENQRVLQNAQSVVEHFQNKKESSELTNIARYKQKLRESSKDKAKKTTVKDTMHKLEERSRLQGGTYGSNNFNSLQTDKESIAITFEDNEY